MRKAGDSTAFWQEIKANEKKNERPKPTRTWFQGQGIEPKRRKIFQAYKVSITKKI